MGSASGAGPGGPGGAEGLAQARHPEAEEAEEAEEFLPQEGLKPIPEESGNEDGDVEMSPPESSSDK